MQDYNTKLNLKFNISLELTLNPSTDSAHPHAKRVHLDPKNVLNEIKVWANSQKFRVNLNYTGFTLNRLSLNAVTSR
jgi:hypothetical protein